MTTYIYVGPTSAGLADGTSWANRYGTLNAAEDRPIVADTVVYVGPGTYRELLTCDVSGAAGQTISYVGDYTGANTDGVGGVARITGSDDDQTATRGQCISADSKTYRTFRGFDLDTCTSTIVAVTNGTNWLIDECYIGAGVASTAGGVSFSGASQSANSVTNCVAYGALNAGGAILFTHSATVDNVASSVSNCMLLGGLYNVQIVRVGGVTVKNCRAHYGVRGIGISTALAAGQTLTVNNCMFYMCTIGMYAVANDGTYVENYNNLWQCQTARSNVGVGANSLTYADLPDTRWFHEATNGGRFVTPFDMASYCALVNVAGTSPTATDMRGTTVQGAEREWGALEYDSTLLLESAAGGGGPVRILPIRGSVG